MNFTDSGTGVRLAAGGRRGAVDRRLRFAPEARRRSPPPIRVRQQQRPVRRRLRTGRSPSSRARRSPARARTSSSTSATGSTSTSTSSTIRADAADMLANQAEWLQPLSGGAGCASKAIATSAARAEYNFALGARRAEFGARLPGRPRRRRLGRITTISYGKERPIDPGDDEDAWAKNRNAHTAITEGAR